MVGVCPGSGLEQTYKDRIRIGDHQPVLVMHPIILNCNNVAYLGHLTNHLDAHQTALPLLSAIKEYRDINLGSGQII